MVCWEKVSRDKPADATERHTGDPGEAEISAANPLNRGLPACTAARSGHEVTG
jgi:hypothetical protein